MSAQSSRVAAGGLSRAWEAASRSSWSEPRGGLACPRPVKPEALPRAPSEPVLRSSSSPTSGSRDADPTSVEAGLAELRRLFAAECSLGTSAPGFGVSPPVRSGAANGLVHDSLWRQEAPRACKASLRALHERAGPRCLSSCAGDYRLLMASPDQGLQLLAGALEEEAAADEPLGPASLGGRSSPAMACGPGSSARASPSPAPSGGWQVPAPGWHPSHCSSPEPADLFSY